MGLGGQMKTALSVTLFITILLMAQAMPKTTDEHSVQTQNKMESADFSSYLNPFTKYASRKRSTSNIHKLYKRWGHAMFGCHCSGFHIRCRSDSYCEARYGHGFKCHKSCCGMSCSH